MLKQMLKQKGHQIKSIVLIDEVPIIETAIKNLFEVCSINVDIVGYADNGVDGLSMIRNLNPDIIILDTDTQFVNTFEIIKRVHENNNKIVIVVFGVLRSSYISNRLIATGANACIDKRWSIKDCGIAFNSIISSNVMCNSRAIRKQSRLIPSSTDHCRLNLLSTRELLILKHLALGERNVDIAKRYTLSDKTISTYKQRISKKLNIKNIFELREYVIKNKLF
jgi:DNA-binding NarL/FixJ family response regulator